MSATQVGDRLVRPFASDWPFAAALVLATLALSRRPRPLSVVRAKGRSWRGITACGGGADQEQLKAEDPVEEDELEQEEDELEQEFAKIRAMQDALEALPAAARAKCASLQDEIVASRALIAERRSAHERLEMEVSNFRSRTRQELLMARSQAAIPVFEELLPFADEFALAKQNLQPESEGEHATAARFDELFDKIVLSWKALGFERLVSVGQAFDPELHEAVTLAPSSEYEEQVVCGELRAGWVLKQPQTKDAKPKVLRPALVIVSSGPGPS